MVPSYWPSIAGIFAFAALFLSIYEIIQHLNHFNKPYLQKYVIRILWMVPIYAMNAWIAMKNPGAALYLDTLRECYEAFVIYSFMKYLTNFLYREMDIETVIDGKPRVRHIFPLHFLPPMPGGRRFLYRCKHGILQYAILRPITTFLALITQMCGLYHEDEYNFKYSFVYLLIINNISQMTAMYCLALFYYAYREELSSMRPLLKFLCIKAVIFMSFFQSVAISILIEIGIIKTGFNESITKTQLGRSLQDFLICFEMFLAALVHLFAFSHQPFVDMAAYSEPACYSFLRVLDFSDERSDVTDHFQQIWARIKSSWRAKRLNPFPTSSNDDDVCIPLRPTHSSPSKSFYQSNESFNSRVSF